ENAAKLANLAVQAAKNIDGITLDYSPASLTFVDQILGKFHAEGLSETQIGATVFSIGCYVGEILIRNCSGKWIWPSKKTAKTLGINEKSIMLVELANGSTWNPIGKAFKFLANGAGDSTEFFYGVASNSDKFNS